jgi:hypothetical protein
MGEVKYGKGHTGATGAPLTRRQQKRARRRQAMAQRQANAQQQTLAQQQPRPAAPPQPPTPPAAAPAPRAQRSAAPRDVAATQPELSTAAKPPKAKRIRTEPEAATPISGEERPPRRAVAARATHPAGAKAAGKKERKASAPVGEAPAQASAPARKYPTLARMAGLRMRPPKSEPLPPLAKQRAAPEQVHVEPPLPVRVPDTPHDLPAEAADSAPVAVDSTPPADMARRPSVLTRRLAPSQRVAAPAAERSGQHTPFPTPEPANAASFAEWRWGQPETAVIAPLAAVHAALATLSSLAGMVLLLQSMPGAVWLLSLAGICGAGGWLAFALAQQDERHALAGAALLLSQLGVLVWLLALFGPRAAILALVPALTLLALRTTWRNLAMAGIVVALALYVADSALTLAGWLQPGLSADAGLQALVDGCFLTLGLGLTLFTLLALHTRQARAEALLRSRLYEARQTRTRARQLRQQIEDDADLLEHSLVRALRGRGIDPIRVGSALGPLAEHIEVVAERLATLQQDREDRIRLDGATRGLTRALERAWLGLPWVWPQASGTALDALSALLRAPRPAEPPAASWPEETPTLVPVPVPVPTVDSSPWDIVTPRPGSPAGGSGGSWPIPLPDAAPDDKRPRVFAASPNTTLPWDEWDAWRSWRSDDER